jgi:hypothetical protein
MKRQKATQPEPPITAENTVETQPRTRPAILAPPPPPDSVFCEEPDILKRLHISRRTLFNWRFSGKLPFVNVGGRRILYHWPSVEAALLRMQRGGGQ